MCVATFSIIHKNFVFVLFSSTHTIKWRCCLTPIMLLIFWAFLFFNSHATFLVYLRILVAVCSACSLWRFKFVFIWNIYLINVLGLPHLKGLYGWICVNVYVCVHMYVCVYVCKYSVADCLVEAFVIVVCLLLLFCWLCYTLNTIY